MTLAAILLVSIFSSLSAQPLVARPPIVLQIVLQTAPASTPPAAPAKQDQSTAPPVQNPTASQPQSSAAPAPSSPPQTTPAAKRPHHKKRVRPANCGTMPAAGGQSASGSTSAGSTSAGSTAASGDPAPATTPAATSPANCPPPKVIVRQGGTSEPSIQLAGGADPGQTSNRRDTANQMLDATEANLKRLAGKQLTANQQDMVSQTRQFMQQSKAAVEAGDLERARTLAWKAQVLSEELVKPER